MLQGMVLMPSQYPCSVMTDIDETLLSSESISVIYINFVYIVSKCFQSGKNIHGITLITTLHASFLSL